MLVGLINKEQTEHLVNEYLDELAFLAETAGARAIKRFTQRLPHPDSRTFIGKGKLEEIKKYVQSKSVELAIFDDELTGSQITNIEKELQVKVIDRSDLILDIFAARAKTAQAKVQVELAQFGDVFCVEVKAVAAQRVAFGAAVPPGVFDAQRFKQSRLQVFH